MGLISFSVMLFLLSFSPEAFSAVSRDVARNILPGDIPEGLDPSFYQKPIPMDEDSSGWDEGPEVEVWPADNMKLKLGQVAGVGVDSNGDVHVFHRGTRKWTIKSFDDKNEFAQIAEGPIEEKTHLKIDHKSGEVIFATGANFFYLPHGLTVDHEDSMWFTDVAMHQVFKFEPGKETPSLVLGEKFKPGSDSRHFCKPTDVAVSSGSREFFVSDGYCNSRIMKFLPDGTFITQFGSESARVNPPFPAGTLAIPHSLALVEDWNMVCVADREHERIQCFAAGLTGGGERRELATGTFIRKAEKLGRVYAIRSLGHYMVGVTNNFDSGTSLFVVNMDNGKSETYDLGFENPHDLAVADDGTVYVGEIGPNRVLKITI